MHQVLFTDGHAEGKCFSLYFAAVYEKFKSECNYCTRELQCGRAYTIRDEMQTPCVSPISCPTCTMYKDCFGSE